MKQKLTLLLLFVLLIWGYACKKDSSVSIIGKWSILKTMAGDTTITGTANDYYVFDADGSLTIQDHSEGTFTGKYNQTSKSKMGITIYTVDGHGLGVITDPSIYTISYTDANNITLTSPPYPSGGQVITYLQKN